MDRKHYKLEKLFQHQLALPALDVLDYFTFAKFTIPQMLLKVKEDKFFRGVRGQIVGIA
jgi:hypothetical protein